MTGTSSGDALNLACLHDTKDENFFEELEISLAPLKRNNVINLWRPQDIPPGRDKEVEISAHLAQSKMVLVLLSRYFIGNDELMRQAERAIKDGIPVIPIIVRYCDRKGTYFEKIKLLPKNEEPIEQVNTNQAWTDVEREIAKMIDEAIHAPQALIDRLIEDKEHLLFRHQFIDISTDFVNRDTVRDKLIQVLTPARADSICFANIWGDPGMGKSFLATYVGYQLVNKYPHAQIKIDLKGATDKPLSPYEIMSEVIRIFRPKIHLPNDVELVKKAYWTCLESTKTVIILDDAANSAQVYPCLPPEGCAMLVTSRKELAIEGVTCLPLDKMEEQHARDMIFKTAGHLPPEVVEDICSSSDLIPLRIRLEAGKYAAMADDNSDQ